MSWLFSQALVEAYSEESFSDGEPSAQSNSTPTPQAFLWPVKTTDAWNRFPSGMTLQPLTENRGEGVLMSFLADFPVKISVVRERAQDSMENAADSGERWRGSFVKYDPDMCLWRTHQCSLLGGFTEFSETWPKWGSMQNGECWERTMLVPTISERESGLMLATPTATANQLAPSTAKHPGCRAWWPTPLAADGSKDPTGSLSRLLQTGHRRGRRDGTTREGKRIWPTPTVQDAKNNGGPSQHRRNDTPLNAMVGGKLNPTWVAWLMGWPLGWTDLNASAMDKYQQWRQLHSGYSEKGGRHDAGRIQYKRNTKRELHPNHAREAR